MLKNIKSLVFDLDGTLHETLAIYKPALEVGINSLGGLKVDRNLAYSLLGKTPKESWKILAPDLTDQEIERVSNLVGIEMRKNLDQGLGRLYPGSHEVLDILSQHYEIYILSNAKEKYLENSIRNLGLGKYLKSYIASETYGYLSKAEIIKKNRHKLQEEILIIGDRENDIEAGYKNNIKSVFCNYGFGSHHEGELADFRINKITDILKILDLDPLK